MRKDRGRERSRFQQKDKVEEVKRARGENKKQGGCKSFINTVGCAGVCLFSFKF